MFKVTVFIDVNIWSLSTMWARNNINGVERLTYN